MAFDIASVQVDRSAFTYVDRESGQELAVSDLKLSTGRIAERADGRALAITGLVLGYGALAALAAWIALVLAL